MGQQFGFQFGKTNESSGVDLAGLFDKETSIIEAFISEFTILFSLI